MNVERLMTLRRAVEAAPEERFHMRAVAEVADCGTAFCALGWFALDPWARKHTDILGILGAYDHAVGDLSGMLAALFDIARQEAVDLFGLRIRSSYGPHCVSRAEVLWNVDELLAGRSTRLYAALGRYLGHDGPFAADRVPADVPERDQFVSRLPECLTWRHMVDDEVALRVVADPKFDPRNKQPQIQIV